MKNGVYIYIILFFFKVSKASNQSYVSYIQRLELKILSEEHFESILTATYSSVGVSKIDYPILLTQYMQTHYNNELLWSAKPN